MKGFLKDKIFRFLGLGSLTLLSLAALASCGKTTQDPTVEPTTPTTVDPTTPPELGQNRNVSSLKIFQKLVSQTFHTRAYNNKIKNFPKRVFLKTNIPQKIYVVVIKTDKSTIFSEHGYDRSSTSSKPINKHIFVF